MLILSAASSAFALHSAAGPRPRLPVAPRASPPAAVQTLVAPSPFTTLLPSRTLTCSTLLRRLFVEPETSFSPAAVAAACSEDVEWVDMDLTEPIRGREAVERHLRAKWPLGSLLKVERLSDGASSGGFTWHREADGVSGSGLRGVTYFELNGESELAYVQEGSEPLFKLDTILEAFLTAANANRQDEAKPPRSYERQTPTTASGIARYLWEVRQAAPRATATAASSHHPAPALSLECARHRALVLVLVLVACPMHEDQAADSRCTSMCAGRLPGRSDAERGAHTPHLSPPWRSKLLLGGAGLARSPSPTAAPSLLQALSFFSDEVVYEDFNYREPFVGLQAVSAYISLLDAFPQFTFLPERISDGDTGVCITWRCEVNGEPGPSGISYNQVDKSGKICFARDIPAPSIKPPPLAAVAARLSPQLRTFQPRAPLPSVAPPPPTALDTLAARPARAAIALAWFSFSAYVALASPGEFSVSADSFDNQLIAKVRLGPGHPSASRPHSLRSFDQCRRLFVRCLAHGLPPCYRRSTTRPASTRSSSPCSTRSASCLAHTRPLPPLLRHLPPLLRHTGTVTPRHVRTSLTRP